MCAWLRSIGLQEHCEAFARNHIDGEALRELSEDDTALKTEVQRRGVKEPKATRMHTCTRAHARARTHAHELTHTHSHSHEHEHEHTHTTHEHTQHDTRACIRVDRWE